MARWLVCALIFLQASLLVLGQEASSENSTSDADTTPKEAEEAATRATKISSTTMPPLVHNSLNGTTLMPNSTGSKNTDKKNAAPSCYSHTVIVAMIAVSLLTSAI